MIEPTVTTSDALPRSLSAQTIACLEYFERWETPLDWDAAECYKRLRHDAPDFATFQRLAPPGSPDRALFERLLDSFEDAGRLIRAGQMREDLFFDAWYALPASWYRAQPYVQGLRAEQSEPQRYEAFEWLALHAQQYWEDRDQHPPQWHPITTAEPSADDQAIFAAFNRHSFPAPDRPGWALFAQLQRQAPTYEAFAQLVPFDSTTYVAFDWLMCAYERAGVLTKNGIIHPALLFATWRSPSEVWQAADVWVKGLQRALEIPHLYESAGWLAAFEHEWRKR